MLTFKSDTKWYVEVREYIGGIRSDIFKPLKMKSYNIQFPGEKTYDGQEAIKIDDLKQIICHISDQHKQFYNNILNW